MEHGSALQPPWRPAMPSLQQPLEGRRRLPNASGLCPGTAGLPDRMAGPADPEGHSSSTPGFPGAQTQGHSLRTWARQGVTTGRAPGKGERESGQWVSLVTRQRASRGTDWLSIGRGTSKLNTPGERRWGEGPGGGSVRERPVPKPGL